MNKIQAANKIIKLAKALAKSGSTRTAGAKYTLTDETKKLGSHIIYRVKYNDGKLGGWIESEKNLQGNAKVLDDAMIYGNAVVKDNAIVKGYSHVSGNAVISETAKITNYSIVDGHAQISGNAKISNSTVSFNAIITDQAKVSKSFIADRAKIYRNATVHNSHIYDDTRIIGNVRSSKTSGNCLIQGEVVRSTLKNRDVLKGDSVSDIKMF